MATKVEVDNITDAWRLGVTAAQIEEAAAKSAWQSNPNLLDNWYFANPVNQRGQTEYGRGYTIDRWTLITTDGSARVNAGSVSVVSGTDAARLDTVLENVLIGEEVTFSILVSETSGKDSMFIYAKVDGTDRAVVNKSAFNTGCVSITGKIPANATKISVRFQSAKTDGATLTVKAAKLELGTQQTLAHQDANGNWVLNEIPDYNEELLKCCMSTADSSDTYANNKRTPAAINAVNKAGDTMTGALTVALSDLVHTVSANPASGSRFAYLQFRDTTNRTAANLKFSNTQLAWQVTPDMSNWVQYSIFHTGNKPSGSYTGNGGAAARTINTGGIGSAIVIWSNAGMCIVTPGGALCKSGTDVSAIDTAEVSFKDGVLTIASAGDLVNGVGYTYTYQVL